MSKESMLGMEMQELDYKGNGIIFKVKNFVRKSYHSGAIYSRYNCKVWSPNWRRC